MRKWQKWINVILAIVLLLTLFTTYFMIYDYGGVSKQILRLSEQDWFFYFLTTITIISGLLGLALLLRAIFSPTIKNYIVDKDGEGQILISPRALESNVKSTLSNFPEIRNSQVDVLVNSSKNEIKTRVYCGVYEGENLNELGSRVQEKVKADLESFAGYPVEEVQVKFYDIKLDTKKRVV